MKRIGLLCLVLFFVASVCFADGDTVSKKVYSYGKINTSGMQLTTIIPVASIRPSIDKIIGYSIIPAAKGSTELYIGLFDGTTTALTGEVFAENETNSPNGVAELWPFGKQIADGVVLNQGANTQVQIYFVRE